MPELEQLFEEFVKRQLAGENPDPFEYMNKLSGEKREELGDLFDAFLENAPREAWDPEAFKGSKAEQIVDQVDRSLHGVAGMWPSLLPRLRHRRKIQRAELVAQFAAALGVADKQEKVGFYYHEMEQGILPSEGVSDKVLEALASIVGVSVDALRRAGKRLGSTEQRSPGEPDAGTAFAARTALPDPDYMPEGAPSAGKAIEAEPDEVDKLFRAG